MTERPESTVRDETDLTRAAPSDAAAGGGFGPYRYVTRLGEGGMGEVWLAEQRTPVRRRVAVKVIKAGMDSAQVIARFDAERQALAVLDHPAIAKIFDGGTTPEGRPYFAMEYVPGEPIVDYCDRHRLPMRARLELLIVLCEGVQHAHQKGIIHRDLKPANVLVAPGDERPVLRIIDFGIAKAVTQSLTDRSQLTQFGTFIGTLEYMSPEQAEMSPVDVDTRTDIYSLGVILYELLVGELPFDREALRQAPFDEMRRTIRETEARKPSTRLTGSREHATKIAASRGTQPARLATMLRGDLDWITLKALEKDRTRRYATANALALDVRRHLDDEPVLAGPPGAVHRTRKFVRRHRVGVALATLLLTLLAVFAVATTVQARRIARERDRANQEAATARQVSEFLVGLFKVSDPSQARGETLTARQILARGALQLDENLRDQPKVQARLQTTIGGVYTALGLYGEAIALLERASQTSRRVNGDDHPETLAAVHELGNAYWYTQRYADAERSYTEVVKRRVRTLGENHPDTLAAQFDLASAYLGEKRLPEFERLAQDTLKRQRRVLGDSHPQTTSSLNNLQHFYYGQGRFTDAEALAVEVVSLRRRVLGNDHPETFTAIHNLATVYEASGRPAQAEALYLESVAGARRVLGADHPSTCLILRGMGRFYEKQRRYGDAESASLAAYEGLAKKMGPEHPETQRAVQALMRLYTVSGQPTKAAHWAAKLQK